MSKKIGKILGIIGFVLLFIGVVYLKTMRKINRGKTGQQDNTEMIEQYKKNKEEQRKNSYEEAKKKEQLRRDSIQKIQHDKMEVERKRMDSIIKVLDKKAKDKN